MYLGGIFYFSNLGELIFKSTVVVIVGERVVSCYLFVIFFLLILGKLLEKNVLEFRVLVLIIGK